MRKDTCIYKITNPFGKVYIGQTKNLYLRKIMYKKLHCHKQHHVYASILKYGYEAHKFEVLESIPADQLNEREKYWIKEYDSFNNGMNLTTGGDAKYSLSEESKLRISESKKGSKNPMFGKTGWNKGIKMSEEHCSRLSLAHKGKQTGANNPFFKGYVHAFKDGVCYGTYEGAGDASRKLKIQQRNINKVIAGQRQTAGGYSFTRGELTHFFS